jgi:excisionase family DNA binding protein
VTTVAVQHEMLTVSETAELLRVSEATIRRRIAVGEIRALRVSARRCESSAKGCRSSACAPRGGSAREAGSRSGHSQEGCSEEGARLPPAATSSSESAANTVSYFDTYFEQYGPDPVTDTLADVSTDFDLTGQVMTLQGWGFQETSREHPVEINLRADSKTGPVGAHLELNPGMGESETFVRPMLLSDATNALSRVGVYIEVVGDGTVEGNLIPA